MLTVLVEDYLLSELGSVVDDGAGAFSANARASACASACAISVVRQSIRVEGDEFRASKARSRAILHKSVRVSEGVDEFGVSASGAEVDDDTGAFRCNDLSAISNALGVWEPPPFNCDNSGSSDCAGLDPGLVVASEGGNIFGDMRGLASGCAPS